MPTLAGQMQNTTPTNPQWVKCNGTWYYVNDWTRTQRTPIPATPSTGNRWDYIRRVGWWGRRGGLGMSGWKFRVPFDSTGTWWVSLADDNTETALVSPPTVQNPPAGVT